MKYQVFYYKYESSKAVSDCKLYKSLTMAKKHAEKIAYERGCGFCSVKDTEKNEVVAVIWF